LTTRANRSHARYSYRGERLVAGIVALTPDANYVLLVQSKGGRNWKLPRGDWELDEEVQDVPAREAWEEAGISIRVYHNLGTATSFILVAWGIFLGNGRLVRK
jgi:diphosphoinositol-polyphosphate diphosphatase